MSARRRFVGRALSVLGLTAALVCTTSVGVAAAKGSKHDAWDVCSEFVRDRLKAPATADFAEYRDRGTGVTKSGRTYTVLGHVDSENSFGANIRTEYICTVRWVRGVTYRLVDLETL